MTDEKPNEGFLNGLPLWLLDTIGNILMFAFVVLCLLGCLVLMIPAAVCELIMYIGDKIATACGFADPDKRLAAGKQGPE